MITSGERIQYVDPYGESRSGRVMNYLKIDHNDYHRGVQGLATPDFLLELDGYFVPFDAKLSPSLNHLKGNGRSQIRGKNVEKLLLGNAKLRDAVYDHFGTIDRPYTEGLFCVPPTIRNIEWLRIYRHDILEFMNSNYTFNYSLDKYLDRPGFSLLHQQRFVLSSLAHEPVVSHLNSISDIVAEETETVYSDAHTYFLTSTKVENELVKALKRYNLPPKVLVQVPYSWEEIHQITGVALSAYHWVNKSVANNGGIASEFQRYPEIKQISQLITFLFKTRSMWQPYLNKVIP